ncbi:hypothetical protein FBU59_000653 [Linderina macrospora]|uniref:Uncharacterized protein n=1 Tax=Linderina macrospora TaxID=4868 RepID=A0ACC1JG79_9FUNG|nr:hypothetical protein FBU59_000653 [Linderina macrospora]
MIVCVNRRNRYAGGQKYLTVFLTILIVLDLALAVLCVVVCRTFNKGLRQRLRHFQILARGEVDLAAVSVPADVAEKLPKGEMSTKLRFFETEHARHSDSSTVRSEHRNEVRRWEMFSPGMADPELVRSFVAEGPKNPHMSRSFASGAQHKQMSRSFASETHTTPAITCSSVDGTVSCVLSSGEFGGAAAAHASTLSSFPSTSFSGVTTDRSFVGTRDFEDDKALYDTLQRPLELRVTNPDVYAQRRAAPSTVSSSTATLRTALSSLSEDPNEGFDEVESPLPPPAYIPSTSK